MLWASSGHAQCFDTIIRSYVLPYQNHRVCSVKMDVRDGQATRGKVYLKAAQQMMHGLLKHTRVDGGFASIRSVATMEKVTTVDDGDNALLLLAL